MKRTPLFASLALCLLALGQVQSPAAVHAQGLLQQQGDSSHGFSILATDQNGNALTGLTLTMRITKQPGTSSVLGTGTFVQTDATNQAGYYFYTPSATDDNTLGDTIFQPVATAGTGYATAVINSRALDVVPWNPYSGANLGLTALPAVAPGASGGLPTANSSNQVNIVPGQSVVASAVNGNMTGNITGSLSGSVGAVLGSVGGSVNSIVQPVTVGTNNDKTGYTATASNLPTDYQQRGVAVTLPSTVLQSADFAALTQAILTAQLHGISVQRMLATIYLTTAGAVVPTKAGTVSTNPFKWPDGVTGQTSTIDSSTNARTETPGTLPN